MIYSTNADNELIILQNKPLNQLVSSSIHEISQQIEKLEDEEDFIHENEQAARIKADEEARLKALYEAKRKFLNST